LEDSLALKPVIYAVCAVTTAVLVLKASPAAFFTNDSAERLALWICHRGHGDHDVSGATRQKQIPSSFKSS